MIKKLRTLFLLFVLLPGHGYSARDIIIIPSDSTLTKTDLIVEKPYIAVEGIKGKFTVRLSEQITDIVTLDIITDNNSQRIEISPGQGFDVPLLPQKKNEVYFRDAGDNLITIKAVPQWMSILPPLIAIVIALIFKEVFTALFLGIFSGTFIISIYGGDSLFPGLLHAVQRIVDTYILESLSDSGHLSIIIFSMLIGAMVNLITRNGGMQGIVNFLSKYSGTSRSGQFITWLLGVLIFFDDYANTLVVGNTMRPVADRLNISREKLAYLVDSTAAPIASIAFVTTWIGAELSYIQDGITTLGLDETPYIVFLHSLKYSFYPILALLFILFLIWRNRDFGPMYHAEKKARLSGNDKSGDDESTFSNNLNDLDPEKNIRIRAYNALIPVFVVVGGTIAGLLVTGLESNPWDPELSFAFNLSNVIGSSDSYRALLWSSLGGVLTAVILTVGGRILTMKKAIDSLINGFRTMLTAILILIMAWSIALITKHMHTADFISRVIVEVSIPPGFVPALTFILAALVAFSTGTSWGTMAILYPLVLPASWLITQETGMEYQQSLDIFHIVVSTVLAGSVLGDHCSPISDTTILSSLASSCNHIQHVRTQLPYALTVGAVAIFIGIIPAAFGVPVWILFIISLLMLLMIIQIFGKRYEH
jgi:Na+/H+ antiporter NhaC